jgi:hypothetical protein
VLLSRGELKQLPLLEETAARRERVVKSGTQMDHASAQQQEAAEYEAPAPALPLSRTEQASPSTAKA